jgi:hypothetical protein
MEELVKRIKSGAWVALGGFVVTVISLALENIGVFELTQQEQAIVVILGTAIVTQITKYLNK